ncbi:HYC_CC_PP family protein [Paracnuella aquatica]|uniref:HYC_CC_PP family protein n=1 Tax=Paracnuella aquatica TaxID=2268757 RepID=UPI000DF001C9|nr:hypothetical protein [Paracnuella aquatica]RPD43459.1 hypothetical protein DRJ53_20005 [Paracnuella aquatica]
MKKVLSTILLILYFTFSAGATMHLHFCMGEFAGISLSDTNTGTCGKCGMESHDEKNDCCKDVPVSFKITDDQSSSSCEQIVDKRWMLVETTFPPLYFVLPSNHKPELFTAFYSPPPDYTAPIYIQTRNLRI